MDRHGANGFDAGREGRTAWARQRRLSPHRRRKGQPRFRGWFDDVKTFDLNAMTRGWFVGDFEPTALATTACEAAVKRYRKGDREEPHFHAIATELTLVVDGSARFSGREISPGGIVVVEPGEVLAFEALSDVTTVVVKVPSAPTDKHPAEPTAPIEADG